MFAASISNIGCAASFFNPSPSRCLRGRSSRCTPLRRKSLKPLVACSEPWKRERFTCRCFIGEVSHVWQEWKEGQGNGKGKGKEIKKLPVVVFKEGRRWQYVCDNNERVWTVEAEEEGVKGRVGGGEGASGWLAEGAGRVGHLLRRSFVPDNVRPHYIVYLKWKLVHRFFSSILHVQCTQAMLWAIGVGAKRRLPAAAAVNWVMKDGLGRLGKLIYAAGLGRTFDSNLKKVRFSTSILFCVSVGLEMLTPVFPHHFLLLATLANIAKSISLSAYLATSSAIHRSFALGDNLADISAKGQAQTVVADNLGLAVAVCISHFCHGYPRVEKLLPFVMYPVLTLLELYAIFHQLQAVHLQTLNKERLEIVTDFWVKEGRVPTFEEVSKVESASLLGPFSGFKRQICLRIGAMSLESTTPEHLTNIIKLQETQLYSLSMERVSPLLWPGKSSTSKHGLVLWLHERASTTDIIMGVLQACHLRAKATTDVCLEPSGTSYTGDLNKTWQDLLVMSRRNAELDFEPLLLAIKNDGWHAKRILLSPQEQCTYGILDNEEASSIQLQILVEKAYRDKDVLPTKILPEVTAPS